MGFCNIYIPKLISPKKTKHFKLDNLVSSPLLLEINNIKGKNITTNKPLWKLRCELYFKIIA